MANLQSLMAVIGITGEKMNRIDLSPLYRSSVGYDRFGSLLDAAFQTEKTSNSYPPYNIEVVAENKYAITLACLLYTSPSPRDQRGSRMPSSA